MDWAHLHLILNHVPIIGTVVGLLLLLAAFMRRSDELKKASLAIFIITALVAIPVFLTGEPAEESVENLPGVSEAMIESHEESALYSLIAVEVLGAISLLGLILIWRARQTAARWVVALSLATSFIAGGLMAWTANLGGQIRHTEIRANASAAGSPETKTEPHGRKETENEEKH